jgi:hypothetical protein
MKTLRLIAWIVAGIAGLLIILAGLSLVTGSNFFGVRHIINYFKVADTFILGAIALFIATKQCCCDCECKEEEKSK